jgi:hypothetical protein
VYGSAKRRGELINFDEKEKAFLAYAKRIKGYLSKERGYVN